MSKIIRKNSLKSYIIDKAGSVEESQIVSASLVHSKPVLTFKVPVADGKQAVFEYQIDPKQLRKEHTARVEAAFARISEARKMTNRLLTIQADKQLSGGGKLEDLPDTDLLLQVLPEYDTAREELLLAMVMVDDDGNTLWTYIDENDEPVNLTKELLQTDRMMAEAIITSLDEWRNPTKPSQEETGKAHGESTTRETTPKTPKVSSSASLSGSTEAGATKKETQDG